MTNTNIHNGPDPDAKQPPPPPHHHTHTHTHTQACINACMSFWRHKHTLIYITIHVRYSGRTEKHSLYCGDYSGSSYQCLITFLSAVTFWTTVPTCKDTAHARQHLLLTKMWGMPEHPCCGEDDRHARQTWRHKGAWSMLDIHYSVHFLSVTPLTSCLHLSTSCPHDLTSCQYLHLLSTMLHFLSISLWLPCWPSG